MKKQLATDLLVIVAFSALYAWAFGTATSSNSIAFSAYDFTMTLSAAMASLGGAYGAEVGVPVAGRLSFSLETPEYDLVIPRKPTRMR